MYNLESIPFEAVANAGVSYKDFRKELRPVYSRVWADISLGYLSLLLLLTAGYFAGRYFSFLQPLWVLLVSAGTGLALSYLALFLHEAGHFNIHPDKKINDRICFLTLGILFGIDIRSYRKIHWQHHLHLGTPEDTEHSYFHSLTAAFLLRLFTGSYLLQMIRAKGKNKWLSDTMIRDSRRMLLVSAVLHGCLVTGFLLLGAPLLAVEWILAVLVFFPFFATIRQLLEHRSETADKNKDYFQTPHGKTSRLFPSDFLSRILGGAGFRQHLLHHWDPQVSYTRLRDVEKFLSGSPATKEFFSKPPDSYLKTFQTLYRR
jgi:fatty acid desaturase